MGADARTAAAQDVGRLDWGTFTDRRQAGRALGARLAAEDLGDAVVVGLARGGVAVAAEVAHRLALPLDALAVRKVGHPFEPEVAIGAVTPDGRAYIRQGPGVDDRTLAGALAAARDASRALDRRLHETTPPVPVAGRTCVLVDDGLATGATMVAAVRWARGHRASRVLVAVPVGAPDTIDRLTREADAVICLQAPDSLFAVGAWYRDFRQVSDTEVVALLDAASASASRREVVIPAGTRSLPGDLVVPAEAAGAVLFAHGSGSGRRSPRNQSVAHRLNRSGLATLLFDLLGPDEALDHRRVFDVPLLAGRLRAATDWARSQPSIAPLPMGYFGASTGAAAALAAAARDTSIRAVVSRGGRPDLTGPDLVDVRAPTLLIVGGDDAPVLALNREVTEQLRCAADLVVIPGATHLFEEPGALEQVAEHAARWFLAHLPDAGQAI
jgi:putative phosphoribosyl transferase